MALRVDTISPEQHLAFLRAQTEAPAESEDRSNDDRPGLPGTVSFLQTPAWGEVKREWRAESIGWRDEAGEIVGAGLVLYRRLPKMRRSLAYLPEGPVIDWADPDLGRWLRPLAEHVTGQGAFGIRMGPPVVTRRWSAATVKNALAAASRGGADSSDAGSGASSGAATNAPRRLGEVEPDVTDPIGTHVVAQLRELGWRPPAEVPGFAAGQPRYVFQLPLAGKDEDAVLAGMNQQWRRNIRKAVKAGVKVTVGTSDDLPAFHELYLETTKRDHFTPRPPAYFEVMYRALAAEDPDRIRLYLARHDDDLVAATLAVRVGRHVWYSYGASSTAKREVRGSNAIQWRMIQDALAAGAAVYDLRGITDTLDADDPHVGLVQFKVGTGGEAIEYVGEWDLPISRLLYAAFDFYLKRRGG